MITYVLDANAVLDYLYHGPCATQVRDLLRRGEKGEARFVISSVQLGEVVFVVTRRAGKERALERPRGTGTSRCRDLASGQ
jgi:predicted nucleic acid-binding protein